MSKRWRIFTFSQEQLFTSDMFHMLSEFIDPAELIHAAIMYFYHNESFHLDELTEDLSSEKLGRMGYSEDDLEELSKTINEATSLWLDDFYEEFERTFKSMVRQRLYVYYRSVYSRRDESVIMIFRRRKPDEPFYPVY